MAHPRRRTPEAVESGQQAAVSTTAAPLLNQPLVITDINNVLCLSAPYGRRDAEAALVDFSGAASEVFGRLFSAEAIEVLTEVHKRLGQARYVVSSTWRNALTRDQLETIFRRAGLPFVADGMLPADKWCTPTLPHDAERLEEIEVWLRLHRPPQSFVVLDDDYSGSSMLPPAIQPDNILANRVILCRRGIGLKREHLEGIIQALQL